MFLDSIAMSLNRSISRHEQVMSYLASRHVYKPEVDVFKLGYSKYVGVPPEDGNDRARFMEEAWKGKKFENKIVFPLQDSMGRVLALVGRAIDMKVYKTFMTEEAKEIGCFFGLYQALPCIYETGIAFVVEGPFDLTAFRLAFPNTVATMTSQIYPNQYDLLEFYCDKIITVFDNDKPGREGAEIATKFKKIDDVNIGFSDPNNCLKKLGVNKFVEYVKKKVRDILPPF